MKHANFAASMVVLLVVLQAITLFAQAPRTISHQGLLTDTGGTPVANASRSVTFKIYDVASGGAALWTETKSVSTSNGVFNTVLGSTVDMIGVDFDQSLWLGVKVATDPEILPRTPLTSVPSAFTLVMPFTEEFEIETKNLGSDGSEGVNEDLVIRAADAHLGLYSDNLGVAGSSRWERSPRDRSSTNGRSIDEQQAATVRFISRLARCLPTVIIQRRSGSTRAAAFVRRSTHSRIVRPLLKESTRAPHRPALAFPAPTREAASAS